MSEINMMPVIGIWVAISPKNLEATSITLFTGILNFSNIGGSFLGTLIQNMFGINETNLPEIWKVILVQSGYLLLVTLSVFIVRLPDPKKDKIECVMSEISKVETEEIK